MTERWSYWNGPDAADRRVAYEDEFRPEYQANGDDVQRRIEATLVAFKAETQVELPEGYASGWRPPSVNEATENAGKLSTHMIANAGDKRDSVDGEYAWWNFRTPHVMEANGLWMEHPVATVVRAWRHAIERAKQAAAAGKSAAQIAATGAPTPWCHQQRTPPASHARIYWPDAKAADEWAEFLAAGGTAGMTFAAYKAIAVIADPEATDPPVAPAKRRR